MAIEQYRQAIGSQPDLVDAHYDLGVLLADRGKTDEAIAEFRTVLKYKHDHGDACYNLAVCLGNQGKTAEAMSYWREAVLLQPNNANTLDELAWRLATCPDASIRDGRQALDLARRAVQLSNGDDPIPLGTLAAAYAEAGQFSEAVKTAQQAIELAAKRGKKAKRKSSAAQIKLYRAHRPYHELPVRHDRGENALDERQSPTWPNLLPRWERRSARSRARRLISLGFS